MTILNKFPSGSRYIPSGSRYGWFESYNKLQRIHKDKKTGQFLLNKEVKKRKAHKVKTDRLIKFLEKSGKI